MAVMNTTNPRPVRQFRFPVFSAVFGLLLVAAVSFGQPDGVGAAGASSPITVKGDRLNASPFEGTLATKTLSIRTEFGSVVVDAAKIKSMSFRESKRGGTTAVIELDDHSRMQGILQTPTISIQSADAVEEIDPATITTMKFVKKIPFSLITILLGLVTLTLMEVVLGVDNIIFLAILVDKLPQPQQRSARNIGLAAALGTRLLLLFSLSWLLGLTRPFFTMPELPFLTDPEARDISFRDLILLVGGLFLVANSVRELHHKLESGKQPETKVKQASRFASIIVQIAIMDIIFSLDSVITAVGMVEEVWVMVVAMVIAMIVMLLFARTISDFVNRNPTIKVLALSFLILIGVLLVAESLGQHIDKGYIYFAMAFAMVIELINMRLRKPNAITIVSSRD
jgi:predicted tellurium resistance membrane protein TerC